MSHREFSCMVLSSDHNPPLAEELNLNQELTTHHKWQGMHRENVLMFHAILLDILDTFDIF